MFSWFGAISFVILIVAVIFLWQCKKTEKKRFAIDRSLKNIEDTLAATENDVNIDVLNKIIAEHNKYVDDYNAWISNYPGKVAALLVGFKKEKRIKMSM